MSMFCYFVLFCACEGRAPGLSLVVYMCWQITNYACTPTFTYNVHVHECDRRGDRRLLHAGAHLQLQDTTGSSSRIKVSLATQGPQCAGLKYRTKQRPLGVKSFSCRRPSSLQANVCTLRRPHQSATLAMRTASQLSPLSLPGLFFFGPGYIIAKLQAISRQQ